MVAAVVAILPSGATELLVEVEVFAAAAVEFMSVDVLGSFSKVKPAGETGYSRHRNMIADHELLPQ